MTIQYAAQTDLAACLALDGHIPEGEYASKLAAKKVYILSEAGEVRALLRYGLFWDSIPFCSLLFVAEERRGHVVEEHPVGVAGEGFAELVEGVHFDFDLQAGAGGAGGA